MFCHLSNNDQTESLVDLSIDQLNVTIQAIILENFVCIIQLNGSYIGLHKNGQFIGSDTNLPKVRDAVLKAWHCIERKHLFLLEMSNERMKLHGHHHDYSVEIEDVPLYLHYNESLELFVIATELGNIYIGWKGKLRLVTRLQNRPLAMKVLNHDEIWVATKDATLWCLSVALRSVKNCQHFSLGQDLQFAFFHEKQCWMILQDGSIYSSLSENTGFTSASLIGKVEKGIQSAGVTDQGYLICESNQSWHCFESNAVPIKNHQKSISECIERSHKSIVQLEMKQTLLYEQFQCSTAILYFVKMQKLSNNTAIQCEIHPQFNGFVSIKWSLDFRLDWHMLSQWTTLVQCVDDQDFVLEEIKLPSGLSHLLHLSNATCQRLNRVLVILVSPISWPLESFEWHIADERLDRLSFANCTPFSKMQSPVNKLDSLIVTPPQHANRLLAVLLDGKVTCDNQIYKVSLFESEGTVQLRWDDASGHCCIWVGGALSQAFMTCLWNRVNYLPILETGELEFTKISL